MNTKKRKGRPKKKYGRRLIPYTTCLTAEDREALGQAAALMEITPATAARIAIRNWVRLRLGTGAAYES